MEPFRSRRYKPSLITEPAYFVICNLICKLGPVTHTENSSQKDRTT